MIFFVTFKIGVVYASLDTIKNARTCLIDDSSVKKSERLSLKVVSLLNCRLS